MAENNAKKLSIQSIKRTGGRIMFIVFSAFLSGILILAGVLFIYSKGKTSPFLDNNGKLLSASISEKIRVNINGVEQGMFIMGKDTANPVILYLHGGMPDYFLTRTYPTGLENYFTVVWWEQRGSGLSYSSSIPRSTMTLEQMISDTKEVTNYLRRRFRKDKIYLMGHSGGTFIGIETAARAPELYYAYIGVAQMVNQLKSESQAYEYMLNQFRLNGNRKMARKLEASPVSLKNGTPKAYLSLRDKAMHSLGIGTTHDMKSVITGIFLPSLVTPEYTIAEKFNLWIGKSKSGVSLLWNNMLTTDLNEQVPELKIPVYFLHGIYDYTVSFSLAKEYFIKLKAPVKGFYTFQQSAHSPIFEEPEKTNKIMKEDVFHRSNDMADFK